jgi:peptidoglycan-associated lipoprotein
MKRRIILLGLSLACVGILAGCPKPAEVKLASPLPIQPEGSTPATPPAVRPAIRQPDIPVTRREPPEETPLSPSPAAQRMVPAKKEAISLKDIYFDFDTAIIREDQKAALNGNAVWLKANPEVKIRIEGHTDERGTSEYNLALGYRRALATRDYLVAAGIEATRIAIMTYGEEQPFILGHDESAWRWNRRAQFVIPSR